MSARLPKRLTSAWLLANTKPRKKARRTKYQPGQDRRVGYWGRYTPGSGELKFHDQNNSHFNVSNTGLIAANTIVNVAAGTGESQRVGRKIRIKSLHLRYTVTLQQTTTLTDTDDGLRVIVYHDKQANGAAAVTTDILETGDYLSFNNLSNKNRFTVLCDKYHDMSSQAGAFDGTNDQFARKTITKTFHKMLDVPIEFSSTTGGLTEIRSNNIGILVISDNGVVDFIWQSRVRYSDN